MGLAEKWNWQWGWMTMQYETWSMKCGLKEIIWKTNNEAWTEGNEMKHEQWSWQCM